MAGLPSETVKALVERGVKLPSPETVYVGREVDLQRISPEAEIHGGCRILGKDTVIGPGAVVGAEGPATVENCRLGRGVQLRGGYFSGAVFLDGAVMGSGAHVRPGTLLEEEASGAHAVGFKQTILLSFVTCGSLINFCDCLMGGGTDRRNHSEVGSSYVHFNFTPHGDKATASLLGDVPHGVMLDRRPIFLGGHGGLVGPARLAFGSVIPAGVIYREDEHHEGRLLVPQPRASWGSRPYEPGVYRGIGRIAVNNLVYIGNVIALREWYRWVRRASTGADEWGRSCVEGALEVLAAVIAERTRRLKELAAKMGESIRLLAEKTMMGSRTREIEDQEYLQKEWPRIEDGLGALAGEEGLGEEPRGRFLAAWEKVSSGRSHVEAVRALDEGTRAAGTDWLDTYVKAAAALWRRPLHSGRR